MRSMYSAVFMKKFHFLNFTFMMVLDKVDNIHVTNMSFHRVGVDDDVIYIKDALFSTAFYENQV